MRSLQDIGKAAGTEHTSSPKPMGTHILGTEGQRGQFIFGQQNANMGLMRDAQSVALGKVGYKSSQMTYLISQEPQKIIM